MNKKLLGAIGGAAAVVIVAVVVLIKLFSEPALVVPETSPAKEYVDLGEKYMEELNYEMAITAYQTALGMDDSDQSIYVGLAGAYESTQQYTQAEGVYKQLMANFPNEDIGYLSLAELYIRQDKKAEAIGVLEQANGMAPTESVQRMYAQTNPAAPTFSLSGGTYYERQIVEMSTDADNGAIFYTLDGSEPTKDSLIYNAFIVLPNGDTQIKAKVINSMGFESATVQADYSLPLESHQVEFVDRQMQNAISSALGIWWSSDLTDDKLATITSIRIVGHEYGEYYTAGITFVENGYEERGYFEDVEGSIATLADLAYMPYLQTVEIAYQPNLDLSGLANHPYLKDLSLIDDDISDLSVIGSLTSLEQLCLGRNNITDINALANLTNLQTLSVWENNITDISAVARMTNLTYLDFANNNVSSISPTTGLTNLTEIWMYSNKVTDLSALVNLTNLRTVMFRDNPSVDTANYRKIYPRLKRTDVMLDTY